MPSLIPFVTEHWQFCLLHFLEFAIWGSWIVVLGNMLKARGFSPKDIGRVYATIPIGSMLSSLIVGALVDRYFRTEWVIGISHLVGAGLLFAISRTYSPRPFFWLSLLYAIAFAPTLVLVNSIVFSHDDDIFGGMAEQGFPWIRVFGTIGWIVAGLSLGLIVRKGNQLDSQPLVLASGLSLILGLYAFTLPATPPQPDPTAPNLLASMLNLFYDTMAMVGDHPVFFLVTFVAAMAMGLYFAFGALFLESTGVAPRVVGPLMTIGQAIEIIFMLLLPWFLVQFGMNYVLLAGITAWALRFGLFAVGRPLPLVLFGIAIHGICFDFFFAAGFINANVIAADNLKATAQAVYGFLVYGLGMYLGSEGSGWLNEYYSRGDAITADSDTPSDATAISATATNIAGTNWRMFWLIPCIIVSVAAALFVGFVVK